MIDVQFVGLQQHLPTNSDKELNMKELDANINSWNSNSVCSDVWSAKNSIFTHYNDCLDTTTAVSTQSFVCDDNIHQIETNSRTNNSDRNHQLANINQTPKSKNDTLKARLSPSCTPLNMSATTNDKTSSDTLLKTPAGFYDRSTPFSGPSIPPLFERDEAYFSDASRSRCSSAESWSVASSGSSDDSASTCSSDCNLQRLDESAASTRCNSPLSPVNRNAHTQKQANSFDESRLCDRLVCSVLSQVISEDFCNDTRVLNCEFDDELDTACSPDAKSILNPLAPTFQAKVDASVSRAASIGRYRPSVVQSSAVSIPFVPQPVTNLVACSYVPAYYVAARPNCSRDLRKNKSTAMHYTPLQDGTGVWTQYSEPIGAYGYPTMIYPGAVDLSRTLRSSYHNQLCFVPQPCVGFVKVGYSMVPQLNNRLSTARKARLGFPSQRVGSRPL